MPDYEIKENNEAENKEEQHAKSWKIPVCGSIASNSIISENKIYFGACDKFIYCLDLNGRLVWKFQTNDSIVCFMNIYQGILYSGSDDSYIYALEKNTGKLKWKFLTGGHVMSGVTIVDEKIYFGSDDGHLYCLNIDGKLEWKFYTTDRVTSSPAVINDSVYFGSYDKNFYCLDLNGKLKWKYYTGSYGAMSPVVVDKDFNTLWQFDNKNNENIHADDISIVFVLWNDKVVCLSGEGKFKWEYITGGLMLYPVNIYNKKIYFGSWDKFVYCLDKDGHILWKANANSEVNSYVKIADDCLYFGTMDSMCVFDLNGKENWKFLTGGPNASIPIVSNGNLYFGSTDTHFYAIDLEKKKLLWKFVTGFPNMMPSLKIMDDIKKITDNRFTTWKPEVIKESHYKLEAVDSDSNYKSENKYASNIQYKSERKYR